LRHQALPAGPRTVHESKHGARNRVAVRKSSMGRQTASFVSRGKRAERPRKGRFSGNDKTCEVRHPMIGCWRVRERSQAMAQGVEECRKRRRQGLFYRCPPVFFGNATRK